MSEHTVPAAPDSGDDPKPCPVRECPYIATYPHHHPSEEVEPLRRRLHAVSATARRYKRERDALQRQVDAVKALHRRGLLNPDSAGSPWVCKRDGEHWPCDTIAALSGGDTPEDEGDEIVRGDEVWLRDLDEQIHEALGAQSVPCDDAACEFVGTPHLHLPPASPDPEKGQPR